MNKIKTKVSLTKESYDYLQSLASLEGNASIAVEKLLQHHKLKKSTLAEDIANDVFRQMSSKIKGMHIAVNENNKLLKVSERILNYQLIKGRFPHPGFDRELSEVEQQRYKHPALHYAHDETKKDIKALQIIKANQKKKKGGY